MRKLESRILIEELQTDGHSPLKFICSDGAVYFVKYRSGKSFDKNEINCLVFEMVCTALLQRLNIPTPEHALITILENSYVPGQITKNKRYVKPGVVALGSKQIERSDMVKEIEVVKKRKEFSKLLNPEDLIRMAIFDLWVDNVDRHSSNYNILTQWQAEKLKYFAIDHAFSFGGLSGMNIFHPATQVNAYRKLIGSQYFCSVTKHFTRLQRLEVAKGFLTLIKQLPIASIIDETFEQIPALWAIGPLLKDRIVAFLQSEQRLLQTEQIAKKFLYQKQRH